MLQIDIQGINAAMSRCHHLRSSSIPGSPLHTALRWADAMLRLRVALLSEDRAAMDGIMQECGSDGSKLVTGTETGPLAAVGIALRKEFQAVQLEMDHVRMLAYVRRALRTGCVREGPTGLDTSQLSTSDLESAIAIGRSHASDASSPVVKAHFFTALFLLNIRRFILSGDWDGVANALLVSHFVLRLLRVLVS